MHFVFHTAGQCVTLLFPTALLNCIGVVHEYLSGVNLAHHLGLNAPLQTCISSGDSSD